jgi:hypothetical protein
MHIFNHPRSLPDPRDFVEPVPDLVAQHTLPLEFDIYQHFPEIPRWDQGQESSCGGHAQARAAQKLAVDDGQTFGENDRVSPRFAYYGARQIMGTQTQDSGVDNRSLFTALKKYGYSHEADCPYTAGDFAEAPSDKCYADALRHDQAVYRRLIPGNGAMRLQLIQGIPIVYGFSVPTYWEDGSWDPATEYLRLPTLQEGFVGGHDTVVTGYDYTMLTYPVPVFYVDNSYGEEWGQSFKAPSGNRGRFAVDYRWFLGQGNQGALVYDLTIITKEN